MKKAFLTDEINMALATLAEWREEAERSHRYDLLPLLGVLEQDFNDQAKLNTLNPATIRKTLYFLGVLMRSQPASRQRFAQTLHYMESERTTPARRYLEKQTAG